MNMKNSNIQYVIVTAARNEESHIEKTISSVISQTILPKRWVIVSDGSIDRTDAIAKRYEANSAFIQLLRREPHSSRNFASKAYAIREGLKLLNGIEYDFIGNLDADVSFAPDYFERLFKKFQENSKLGIAGGAIFEEIDGKRVALYSTYSWSVSGAVQMFRRKCYVDIAGYIPLQKGGEDAIAEIMARMHEWKVKSFVDIPVIHHRRMGTEKGHILIVKFHNGIQEYCYGSHPLFEIAKCISRIRERPYFIGSLLRLIGYGWAYLQRDKHGVPGEVVKFLRREQMRRLYEFFSKKKSKS